MGRGSRADVEVPKDRPSKFITLERVGGGTSQFLDQPTVAIQTWADSRLHAATLADELRVALGRITEVQQVLASDQTAYYNWPDPASKQSRYQLSVDLVVKWNHET